MVRPHEIQVLRLPASGSAISVVTLDTCIYDNSGAHHLDAKTIKLEAYLGHVPDLCPFQNRINLDYRGLFNRKNSVDAVRDELDGRYFIYKCFVNEANLPTNKNLGELGGRPAYGDAFIFRLSESKSFEGADGQGKAIFGKMEKFDHSFHNHGRVYGIVKQMANW